MSHLPERKEKVCLNCQAEVHGRYCHVCGQENIEPHESFWHLLTHFVYDITHFDGKFFSTIRYLLFKPGFLSSEYLRGRRASYLHPIRMYVFTSAFFFLVFFSVKKDEEVVKTNTSVETAAEIVQQLEKKKERTMRRLEKKDSLSAQRVQELSTLLTNIDSDLAMIRRDTNDQRRLRTINHEFNIIGAESSEYRNLNHYDSVQAAKPASQKDGFLKRRLTRQSLHLQEKYNNDSRQIWNAILNKFRHLFPQMLFLSLPLFALMLKLLYIRRKQFYYVNHAIYTIHLYCGTFIIILLGMMLSSLAGYFHLESVRNWTGGIFTLLGMYYWYKTMRNFYGQRRGKTILKYMLMFFLSTILMAFVFTIFLAFSAMSI